MLETAWEKYATDLANAMSEAALVAKYNEIAADNKIDLTAPANIVFARDTRASGSRLVECLTAALDATNCKATDMKLATTPQLHYYTRAINTKGTPEEYGEASEKGYYEKLSTAFKQVMEHVKTKGHLTVDCANGVGGPKLRELVKYLPGQSQRGIDITIINDDVHKPDNLNHQVCSLPCSTLLVRC